MNRGMCLAFAFLASASVGVAQDGERVEIGKKAPDFVMTGIDGKELKLSDKIGKDKNVVLMFSRANW